MRKLSRSVAGVLSLLAAGTATAAPFQDAQNRVWELSYGPRGYIGMAQIFDPISGYAYSGSGLRWATNSEVMEFGAQITGQEFFSRYNCTYGICKLPTPPTYPSLPTVFGGVVREAIEFVPVPGGTEAQQRNVYFISQISINDIYLPPGEWVYSWGSLSAFSDLYKLGGEQTQDGVWAYYSVPAPASVALLGLGLVGIGVARRKQA
jgi:hypothetical protein